MDRGLTEQEQRKEEEPRHGETLVVQNLVQMLDGETIGGLELSSHPRWERPLFVDENGGKQNLSCSPKSQGQPSRPDDHHLSIHAPHPNIGYGSGYIRSGVASRRLEDASRSGLANKQCKNSACRRSTIVSTMGLIDSGIRATSPRAAV